MKKAFTIPALIMFIAMLSSCTLFIEPESPSKVVENFSTFLYYGEIENASE